MEHSEQLNELGAALAKAQASVKGAKKDSANPFFKSSYADLASVWEACREALTANGLSVVQLPGFENGIATLDTVLLHSSGQWISGKAGAPLGKQDAQGVGSVITYLRRYALAAVASVSPADDDAEGAVDRTPVRGKARGTGAKEPSPPPPPAPDYSNVPTALAQPEPPMPWEAPKRAQLSDEVPPTYGKGFWKGKAMSGMATDDLVGLRKWMEKSPGKWTEKVDEIDTVLASREGE